MRIMSSSLLAVERTPKDRSLSGQHAMRRIPSGTLKRCCHCGLCVGICPAGVLRLNEAAYPEIVAAERCTSCGLCVASCPGRGVDFAKLEDLFCDGNKTHPVAGRYHNTWLGRDPDDARVLDSSAGGVVSAVVRHCLETGLVDVSVGVRSEPSGKALPYVITSPEGIAQARQSKYQIAPVCSLLQTIPKDKKIIFVGTGCQVAAVRKLQARNSTWRERIPLVVGIYCATGNLAPEALPFLCRLLNIDPNSVRDLQFRNGPYPGRVRVETSDGTVGTLTKDEYKWLYVLFTEPRCMDCPDLTNTLSDIAVGDPFHLATHPAGQSAVSARSSRGLELLETMRETRALLLDPLDTDALARAQGLAFAMAWENLTQQTSTGARLTGARFTKPSSRANTFRSPFRTRLMLAVFRLVFALRAPLTFGFNLLPGSVFKELSRMTSRG